MGGRRSRPGGGLDHPPAVGRELLLGFWGCCRCKALLWMVFRALGTELCVCSSRESKSQAAASGRCQILYLQSRLPDLGYRPSVLFCSGAWRAASISSLQTLVLLTSSHLALPSALAVSSSAPGSRSTVGPFAPPGSSLASAPLPSSPSSCPLSRPSVGLNYSRLPPYLAAADLPFLFTCAPPASQPALLEHLLLLLLLLLP